MIRITPKVKKRLDSLWEFCRKHLCVVVGLVLFFIGGITLGIVGLLTTFFVETLVKRIKKDSGLETILENPFNKDDQNIDKTDEPFEGALLVAALGYYCTGNVDFAGMQMQRRFSHLYTADWVSLCRVATYSEGINGDLIVECLGATLLKQNENGEKNDELLLLIFAFLTIVEYDWNAERGVKPSDYLAVLLQRPMHEERKVEELSNAYHLLGLSRDADLESVKSAHRNLVALYHPDTLIDLTEEQKKIAAEAFLRIQTAYENIIAIHNT